MIRELYQKPSDHRVAILAIGSNDPVAHNYDGSVGHDLWAVAQLAKNSGIYRSCCN